MIDLFYPIPRKQIGRAVMQGVVSEENKVERARRLQKESERRYRARNRAIIAKKAAEWQKANPEKHREAVDRYQQKNRERHLALRKRFRMKNREKLAEKARAYRLKQKSK